MAYSEKVIDHYENPRNVGVLDKNAENVGTPMVSAAINAACTTTASDTARRRPGGEGGENWSRSS